MSYISREAYSTIPDGPTPPGIVVADRGHCGLQARALGGTAGCCPAVLPHLAPPVTAPSRNFSRMLHAPQPPVQPLMQERALSYYKLDRCLIIEYAIKCGSRLRRLNL